MLIIGAWIVAALLGPLSFFLVVSRGNPEPVVASAEFPAPKVAFAEVVATDFLAAQPTLMPVVQGLDPTFGFQDDSVPFAYQSIALQSVYDSTVPQGEGTADITVITFRVQADDGTMYDLSVTLSDDGRGHPVLTAMPALRQSVLAATDSIAAVDYLETPGMIDPSTQMLTAVEQWAKAYVSDDRPQLKVLINGAAAGDAPTGDYVGLGGYTLVGTPDIVSAVAVADESDTAYARIRFAFTAGADGFTATNELDVLIAQASSNDPRVVAWGAPGTGPALVPFQNNTANQ